MADWKEKRRSEYAEKLKDPRWQKMRLQILDRDGWACYVCGDTESTLHVHHLYYENNKQPWEYPPEALLTLCVDCHESETQSRAGEEKLLLDTLRKRRFFSGDLLDIAAGLAWVADTSPYPSHVTAHVIRTAFENPQFVEDMFAWFFARQKRISEKLRRQPQSDSQVQEAQGE